MATIFSYLHTDDLFNSILFVCRHWMTLVRSPVIWSMRSSLHIPHPCSQLSHFAPNPLALLPHDTCAMTLTSISMNIKGSNATPQCLKDITTFLNECTSLRRLVLTGDTDQPLITIILPHDMSASSSVVSTSSSSSPLPRLCHLESRYVNTSSDKRLPSSLITYIGHSCDVQWHGLPSLLQTLVLISPKDLPPISILSTSFHHIRTLIMTCIDPQWRINFILPRDSMPMIEHVTIHTRSRGQLMNIHYLLPGLGPRLRSLSIEISNGALRALPNQYDNINDGWSLEHKHWPVLAHLQLDGAYDRDSAPLIHWMTSINHAHPRLMTMMITGAWGFSTHQMHDMWHIILNTKTTMKKSSKEDTDISSSPSSSFISPESIDTGDGIAPVLIQTGVTASLLNRIVTWRHPYDPLHYNVVATTDDGFDFKRGASSSSPSRPSKKMSAVQLRLHNRLLEKPGLVVSASSRSMVADEPTKRVMASMLQIKSDDGYNGAVVTVVLHPWLDPQNDQSWAPLHHSAIIPSHYMASLSSTAATSVTSNITTQASSLNNENQAAHRVVIIHRRYVNIVKDSVLQLLQRGHWIQLISREIHASVRVNHAITTTPSSSSHHHDGHGSSCDIDEGNEERYHDGGMSSSPCFFDWSTILKISSSSSICDDVNCICQVPIT
jgi:hypothetical protein